jgi:DHA1 family multidrug resistance protein-like MFS transporter
LATSKKMLPLLLIMAAIFAGPQMISPIIALSIRDMAPPEITATLSGQALGLIGILSVISSVIVGKLGTKFPLPKIMFICCLVTGLLYLPPVWAGTVSQLIIFIGLTGLSMGGLQTSTNTMIGLSSPRDQKGIAYGLATSANSLGTGLGSFIGGSLAPVIGLRPVFAVAAGLFLVISVLITRILVPRPIEGSPVEALR